MRSKLYQRLALQRTGGIKIYRQVYSTTRERERQCHRDSRECAIKVLNKNIPSKRRKRPDVSSSLRGRERERADSLKALYFIGFPALDGTGLLTPRVTQFDPRSLCFSCSTQLIRSFLQANFHHRLLHLPPNELWIAYWNWCRKVSSLCVRACVHLAWLLLKLNIDSNTGSARYLFCSVLHFKNIKQANFLTYE